MENRKKVDLVEQARQLRMQLEALEKQVARGTHREVRTGPAIVAPKHGPYYVGDEGPTEQLMSVIKDMLTEHPMRFQQILEATGARENRIKGVIMRLQRDGVRVVDVASEGAGKALWFIPSDEVLKRIAHARRVARDKR